VPTSKHRRKGKTRKRVNLKTAPPPPLQPIDYEWERHKTALEDVQLRKMYGEPSPDGWTDDQIDALIEEMHRAQQQDPLLMARLRTMYGGDWGDWTDNDIDEALRKIWRESSKTRKREPETETGSAR
jgi:hypothetical protein